jgi:hypothetical protein
MRCYPLPPFYVERCWVTWRYMLSATSITPTSSRSQMGWWWRTWSIIEKKSLEVKIYTYKKNLLERRTAGAALGLRGHSYGLFANVLISGFVLIALETLESSVWTSLKEVVLVSRWGGGDASVVVITEVVVSGDAGDASVSLGSNIVVSLSGCSGGRHCVRLWGWWLSQWVWWCGSGEVLKRSSWRYRTDHV